MLGLGNHSLLFRFVYCDKCPEKEIRETIAHCGHYCILNVTMKNVVLCVQFLSLSLVSSSYFQVLAWIRTSYLFSVNNIHCVVITLIRVIPQ